MASSSAPRTWKYRVFTSFHGPDVRKTFLSHLRKQFSLNGISMFNDGEIERSQTIAPALTQAIRQSRISIVVLSKDYASSSWCLDELVEIFKCKEDLGQIVMTVFYGVDPSDVRKQIGDFGKVFKKTCARKTEEERRRWRHALTDASNIAGEHFLNWDNEAKMIEKIAKDVLYKLNVTPSMDFDGMIGLEAHLRKMECLLDLDYDGVTMVAISGPAGIGKTTIARALYNKLSSRFQLTCFVDNLRASYHNGFDEYGLKLCLQEQFLSKILNQNGLRISHLGAIKENLSEQKVLIILDDVNNLKQLEALANKPNWFGPGSRIVVTTENKELLKQHGINNTYQVKFPSYQEALKILCRYAFTQSSPHDGFVKLAKRITKICGNLPLGLRVVGSLLRGKDEEEWEDVMSRLEIILDRDIADVLSVGYENLYENEQTLFLHIAVFLNCEDGDLVKAMFADSNLDVKSSLKILVNRSLINIDYLTKSIVIHKLLQQMARQAIHKQEPWKRQILMDVHQIRDVLENKAGTRNVVGISFDISRINEVFISQIAFKRMPNLRFLRIYGNDKVHIHDEMEFPVHLRLLQWEEYPNKCLPPTFHLEYLVKLDMNHSQLEKLWEGIQPLMNLKNMDLSWSSQLRKLPDLSNATNMEKLNLNGCERLVEIPSSFSKLHKLQNLTMMCCMNLQVIPAHMNLASLEYVNMIKCSRLRNIPVMSTNIKRMDISMTAVEDVDTSIRLCSLLECLTISYNGNVKEIKHLPSSVARLDLSYSNIEKMPDCMKALDQLQKLNLSSCRRLASLPELPGSLQYLTISGCRRLTSLPKLPCCLKDLEAEDCESLETVFFPLNHSRSANLNFTNCFKLEEQARAIIKSSFYWKRAILPGRELPLKFNHRARGNSLTIQTDVNNPFSAFSRFEVCVVVPPNHQFCKCKPCLYCSLTIDGYLDPHYKDMLVYVGDVSKWLTEHLIIYNTPYIWKECREIVFGFSSKFQDLDIIECGAQILTFERSYEFEQRDALEDEAKYGDHINEVICDETLEVDEHTNCWSWLFLCFDLGRNIRSLVFWEEDR